MNEARMREERRRKMATAHTIIIKVGSAVLTGESGLDQTLMNSLASQIAGMLQPSDGHSDNPHRRIVLVSSGSVAAGRAAMRKAGKADSTNTPKARHGLAAIGQALLMHSWNMAFAPHAIIAGQVLLTREDLRARDRFHFASDTFSEMLDWGVVPIVNENDTVSVMGLNFGDNDYLASLLVNLVDADLFVNLTSASAVLDKKPENNPDAQPIRYLENIRGLDIDALCGTGTSIGSGGMRSKLLAARRVAQLGVPTLILPGRSPDILKRAFSGASGTENAQDEDLGTWICPSEKSVSRRKFWLAYQSAPQGQLEIDAGAADALLHHGGSLLPGGICKVSGDFKSGDLLLVRYNDANIGVGFSNYSSEELEKIRGLKRHEVAAILGKARYPDVIHRDNLLLDAAIGT